MKCGTSCVKPFTITTTEPSDRFSSLGALSGERGSDAGAIFICMILGSVTQSRFHAICAKSRGTSAPGHA